MTFRYQPLPHGQYRAHLIRRRMIPPSAHREGDGEHVELTASIVGGPFAGRLVTCKVWGKARIARARSFKAGQLLRLHVALHRLDDGRMVERVVDFHADEQLTVADAITGGLVPASDAADVSQPRAIVAELPDSLRERLTAAIEGRPAREQQSRPGLANFLAANLVADREAWAAEYRLGCLRAGGKSGTRSLVDFEEQLRAFSNGPGNVGVATQGYLSVGQFSTALEKYRQANAKKSVGGYRGRSWARWLAFDLDDDNTPAGIDRTLGAARRLVAALVALGVPRDRILVFFSGQRGCHVLLPSGSLGAAPKEGFEGAAGRACEGIARAADITIDKHIYNPLAMLRAPNTPHDVSGLFKVILSAEELTGADAESVRALARAPRPFMVPDWRVPPVPLLVDLWHWACTTADAQARQIAQVAQGEQRIFADTFDLLAHGAKEGERGVRYFRAAMNLLDLGCNPELLVALLEPSARFSGYPAEQFQSQIEGAIKAHDGGQKTP